MSHYDTDRRIHATTAGGESVVRYDRAGKWYAENGAQRRRLSLAEAVRLATGAGARYYAGMPGGYQFDAAVRRAKAASV